MRATKLIHTLLLFAGTAPVVAQGCATDSRLGGVQDGRRIRGDVAVGSCAGNGSRNCSITLAEHGGVLSCYHGTQQCLDGAWTACGSGELSSINQTTAQQRVLFAITGAGECESNPCDPYCLELEREPDAGSGTSVIDPGGGFEWQTGTLSGLPGGLANKGLNEPCTLGSDCQFNTYCQYPLSGSCTHSQCETGVSLTTGCNDCVTEICAADSTCCTSTTTAIVDCDHDPCAEGDALDSSCDGCVSEICAAFPSCCTTTWDSTCTAAVVSVCGNTCECAAGEVADSDRCYYHEESDENWDNARDACQDRGVGWDLVSIEDATENSFVVDNVLDNSETWIGFTDDNSFSSEGQWVWASGEPTGTWVAGTTTTTLVPYGSTWKYNATGTDPGSTWNSTTFDDAAWSSGAGQLGFGDGDEATTLSINNPSFYFRKTLTLTSLPSTATLSVLYGDGYYAYVNGTLVASANVSGTSHSTWASGSAENATSTNTISATPFVVGTNVIAVQVKNRSTSSNPSDLSFDLKLDVGTPTDTTPYQNFGSGEPGSNDCAQFVANAVGTWQDESCTDQTDSVCEGPGTQMVESGGVPSSGPWSAVPFGSTWKYRADNTDPGSSWVNTSYDDASWSSGPAQLGFGESDETTTFVKNGPSYYFRHTVNIPGAISAAALSMVFDDGFVVYINGTEVESRNITSTSHSSYADSGSSDNEELTVTLDTSAFVVGDNVVAVLMKNRSSSSDDLSFDLKLRVNLCGSGGCPDAPAWTDTCVAMVGSVCDAVCDTDVPPAETGQCVGWYPGQIDSACDGVDLAVGIPCDGNVPVCNHGTQTAPAGVRLIHFPANSNQYPNCDPDQSHPQMYECFTSESIAPGACVNVTTCPQLVGNREIMVNPAGSDYVDECSCADNWSLYSNGECGEPTCDGGSSVATLISQPVDVIFIIDNSGSMQGEIEQVQQRINEDFAQIIADSGLDYRVIMISRYGDIATAVGGSNYPICVQAPLGGHDCSDPISQGVAHNPPNFYHFSADVGSTDPLCLLIEGLSSSDELASDTRPWTPVAPAGYLDLLRTEARKAFVVITDDHVDCSYGGYSFDDNDNTTSGTLVGATFDAALLTLSPEQFGTSTDRNYVFHSIVAMSENSPGTEPWPSTSAIQTGECTPGAEAPGTGYQALSILTGGLRYPTCRNDDFDAIFQAVAEEVIEGAEVSCSIALNSNEGADPDQTTVTFLPDGDDTPLTFTRVDDEGSCTSDGYYYEDSATITLCPATCALVQADLSGTLGVEVGCVGTEQYTAQTFTEVYEGECDAANRVQWGFLTYNTTTPSDANVTFRIRTAPTEAALAAAAWVDVATATSSPDDTQICALTGPSPCPIDLYTALAGNPAVHFPFAEVEVTLNPSSDANSPASIQNWEVTYSCPFAQ